MSAFSQSRHLADRSLNELARLGATLPRTNSRLLPVKFGLAFKTQQRRIGMAETTTTEDHGPTHTAFFLTAALDEMWPVRQRG